MKFYDFVDKQPAIGRLVIVEGTQRALAERALELLVDRVLPPEMRELNLERFSPADAENAGRVREAVAAMPFLASSRLVVVLDAQTLKAEPRRRLWEVAQAVPEGNTLVLMDLLAPRSQRPQPFGAMAARAALRIDTTADQDVRARFIEETLERLNAKAEKRVVDELARGEADLSSVRNDLEKLAIGGEKITYAALQRESLSIEDPKAYRYAGALLEGRTAEALGIAEEMLASDPRGAAIPLIAALATECGLVWELARKGGTLPARAQWRERALRPIAARVGERRARLAYERAVRGFESIVTGRVEDPRLVVEMLTAELSGLGRR
ncbi:MAG: DNA polymerase III subunit delta [Vulcanimicrobiaceae bacterium]